MTGHNYLVTKKGANPGAWPMRRCRCCWSSSTKRCRSCTSAASTSARCPSSSRWPPGPPACPGCLGTWKLALDAIPSGQNFDKVVGFLDFHYAFGPELTKAMDAQVSVEQARREHDAGQQRTVLLQAAR